MLVAAADSTQDPTNLVRKYLHRVGIVEADRTNSRIAFARRAEGSWVPSQLWMLARGESSSPQRQKGPKLLRWQPLRA